ncbi:MAG: hypothetical protein KAG97_09105, partial [Victivallales bacterium]|nr:hypothetical protein [Victivallales bacterium]
MTSILFKKAGKGPEHSDKECDDLFADLNLDQIIHEILSGKKDLCLEGLFKTPLSDIESIAYRQDALQDMENEKLFADLMRFSREMAESKRQLALESGLRHQEHRDGWFLEAALSYVEAVSTLLDDLSDADLKSDALTEWRRWLTAYAEGVEFKKLAERSKEVEKGLSAAKYTVQIKGNTCSVRKFSGESNHETEIGLTFAKFQEGAVKEYLSAAKFKSSGMNHVKGRILELVAKLHPDEFEALRKFRADFADFLDERISAFDRESQFLLAYLGYISPMREKGLKFCYPEMTTEKGDIGAEEVFDLAFARKLLHKDAEIVVNDFNLKGKKRILVVSGPNQGGKTTFARTFGQTH